MPAFTINKDQYESFSFRVPPSHSFARIQVISSKPVDVLLLSTSEFAEYDDEDSDDFSVEESWERRMEVDKIVRLRPGIWYVVIEGRKAAAAGFVEISTG